MHPNTTKHTKTWVYGPMVWIRCARCEKFWSDLVARTFALIAPVQPILHWVSCSTEMIPNPPRHYENAPKHEFRVRWCGSGGFVPKTSNGTLCINFCINCNNSSCFEPSIIKQRNGPKCTQTLQNATKHEFWVQWGGSGAFVAKNLIRLRGTNFCNTCITSARFALRYMR